MAKNNFHKNGLQTNSQIPNTNLPDMSECNVSEDGKQFIKE
jgi:hypothetical protein